MKHRTIILAFVIACFTAIPAQARYLQMQQQHSYVQNRPPAISPTVTIQQVGARPVTATVAPRQTIQPTVHAAALSSSLHPVAQFKSQPLQLKQYQDGMNLYQYAKSDPVNYVDPWGLVCSVVVKRFVITGSSWIDLGHEWLSTGSGSIGFWPNGAGIPGREWSVFSPDPGESSLKAPDIIWDTKRDNGWFNEKKINWGTGKGKKCCTATCSDITSCVLSSPDPGWKDMPIFNNCRTFVSLTLKGCCLSKGKRR